MTKTLLIAAVAVAVSALVSTAPAYAFTYKGPIKPIIWSFFNKGGHTTEVGDAFDPRSTGVMTTAELNQLCLEAGGTPGRRFQDDAFQFYCKQ